MLKKIFHYFGAYWHNYRCQAVVMLMVIGIQFNALEGPNVSLYKVTFLCCTPLLLARIKGLNVEAAMGGLLYLFAIYASFFLSGGTYSVLSLLYTNAFVIAYVYYCTLLSNKAFSYDSYFEFLKKAIVIATYVLVAQQICKLLHLPVWWILNHPVGWKAPSFFIESSHFARVMTVAFYVFIELIRLRRKGDVTFVELWLKERKTSVCFLYSMVTMGSATGIMGLLLILTYILMKSKGGNFLMFILFGSFLLIFLLKDNEAYQRLIAVLQEFNTLDYERIRNVDNSAAQRVSVYFAFFENFKPTTWNFWIGNGLDYEKANVGILLIYGAFAWLAQIMLFMRCAFRGLLSFDTLLFVILFAMCIGNIAYGWTAIYLLTTLKYIYKEDYSQKTN